MKYKFSIPLFVLYLFVNLSGYAQCKDWNWPVDKKTAQEKVTLLQDAVNAKKYKQAINPLNWLIANSPQINSSLYIHGATIYDGLASKEKQPTVKKRYIDSLMVIYNLRIEQCGQKESVLNRKALSAFKYHINGPEVNKVLSLMDTAFLLNGNEISDATLFPYMQTIVVFQGKYKTLTEEDILNRYENLVKIMDFKINASKSDPKAHAKLEKTKKDIDEWLFKIIRPDCDFVEKNLAPKFKQNPDDIVLAKRVFSFMLQGKCTDDPLWLETGEAIYAKEKDFGLGKNLALRYFSLENYVKAEAYINECLPIAPTRSDSSEMYYYKGALDNIKDQKQRAREYYLISVRLDPKRKEAYERIGDMYFSSFDECAMEQKQADDRAIYLAAYEYYAKAGNQKKMAMSKQVFPSREEIFLVDYQVGDKIKVGCWINEDVTIQTRD